MHWLATNYLKCDLEVNTGQILTNITKYFPLGMKNKAIACYVCLYSWIVNFILNKFYKLGMGKMQTNICVYSREYKYIEFTLSFPRSIRWYWPSNTECETHVNRTNIFLLKWKTLRRLVPFVGILCAVSNYYLFKFGGYTNNICEQCEHSVCCEFSANNCEQCTLYAHSICSFFITDATYVYFVAFTWVNTYNN